MTYTDEDIWARYYDHISPGVEGDVEFYVELAREADGPILELGCGNGRVLCAVAGATEHSVTGLDLSRPMLTACEARRQHQPEPARGRVRLVQGDMADFTVDEPAALILIPYRAFQHLMTAEHQMASLGCIRRALAPGGRVCIDLFDPRLDAVAAQGRHLDATPVPRVDFLDAATGHAVHVETAWREWSPEEQTFAEEWTFTEFEGDRVVGEYAAMLRLRYAFRWEMEHLFTRCGFDVEALYGDFTRAPFRYGAEHIWLLRASA